MRITAGTFRGRIIKAPDGVAVRPTTDKNRQAIFNIIQKYGLPADTNVLDLFCGTGSLGLESLSRGASSCVFVDRDRNSIAFARENAAMLDVLGVSTFIQKECTKIGPRPSGARLADLVFLDPPYRQGLIGPALEALVSTQSGKNAWLAPSAIVVLESETGVPGDELSGLPLQLLDSRVYGDTMIRILRHTDQE